MVEREKITRRKISIAVWIQYYYYFSSSIKQLNAHTHRQYVRYYIHYIHVLETGGPRHSVRSGSVPRTKLNNGAAEEMGDAGDVGRPRGLINFQSHVSFSWSDDRMADCLAFLSTNC